MQSSKLAVGKQFLDLTEPAWMQQAVQLPAQDPRVLKLTGPDALDFLQRLTTNDMRNVNSERAAVTGLLSPVGKIRSIFVVVESDDGYMLISGPGEAPALREMLQKQIFFMDDVKVMDCSNEWQVFQLVGNESGKAIEGLGLEGSNWQEGAVRRAGPLSAIKLERLEFPGVYLLCPAMRADDVGKSFTDSGVRPIESWSSYNLQRILAKRAGFGWEINGDYNPLEIGLEWICAENKGCYPGQEVIARQITYGKITRQLVLLSLPEPVENHAKVKAGKSNIGYITSGEQLSPEGESFGLAVLRTANLNGLEEVTVQGRKALIC